MLFLGMGWRPGSSGQDGRVSREPSSGLQPDARSLSPQREHDRRVIACPMLPENGA